ncbi:hypothetical protein ABBQ32_001294 [Trebouxia sp. C0010 RCD-2024]
MGCSSSTHRHVANPIEQVETKAVAQDAKSSTEIPGVPPPVRLVVNATSPSQVSSTPILGNEAASGPRRRPTVDVYKGAVFPPNETERMEAFSAIGLGTAPHDPTTARLCHLLSKLLQVPCCNIHFINEGVFQINTSQGLTAFKQDFCPETLDRKLSLCAWTLLPESPEVLVVPDALQDVRFRDHPMMKGEPYFRFYAGCPLVTFQGFRLGTVCCLDGQPHTLTVQDCNMLCNFAELVVREVEKKHVAGELTVNTLGSVPEKSAASDYYSEGIFIVDAADATKCPILWLNAMCKQIIGVEDDKAFESCLADFFAFTDASEEGKQSKREEFATRIKEGAEFTARACKCKTGSTGMVDLHFRPITSDMVDDQMPLIGIPSFIKPAGPSAVQCTHYFVSVRPTDRLQPTLPSGAPDTAASAEPCELPCTTTLSKPTPSGASTLAGVELGQFITKTQMGRVFRGIYNADPVTVKVVEQQVQGEAAQELAEATLTAGLSHPNTVITLKTISRTRTTGRCQLRRYKSKKVLVSEGEASEPSKPKSQILEFWLVRECCDKGSLMDAMERGWFMTEDSVLNSEPTCDLFAVYSTAKDIACAMAYIHSKDIIHGDLQGDALGLASSTQDPRGFIAKVWDFDVAVRAQKDPVPCSTQVFSLAHLAPETISEKHLTKASDVYAFGVLLWELVCGEEAWLGLVNEAIITTVVQQKTQLKFKDTHPSAYTELALECMAYDPVARPSFQQIEERLTTMQASQEPTSDKAFLRSGGNAVKAA